jgi:CRISPR-associated protein Cas5h
MDVEKLLVFDIFAPFAHFRVPYTTTSPITYPIPPKTAIAGIVSAIIGIDKNEYLSYFNSSNFRVGIKIINPIKMIHICENFLNVKEVKFFARWEKRKNPRTQIKVEFLKDVKYRLYIWHSDNTIYSKLKRNLYEHNSFYTLCLGLSECLANFEFVGEYSLTSKTTDNPVEISSVIPLEQIKQDSLIFDNTPSRYLKVHLPVELSENRELKKTEEILIERDGKTVQLKSVNFFECNKENIFLF